MLQDRQKPCFSASPSCRPPSIAYVSEQWWRIGWLDQVRREATVRCTVQSIGFADSPKQCGAQDRQRAQWRGRIRPLCSMDLNVTSRRSPSPPIATGLHPPTHSLVVPRPGAVHGFCAPSEDLSGRECLSLTKRSCTPAPRHATAQAQPLSPRMEVPLGDLAGRALTEWREIARANRPWPGRSWSAGTDNAHAICATVRAPASREDGAAHRYLQIRTRAMDLGHHQKRPQH